MRILFNFKITLKRIEMLLMHALVLELLITDDNPGQHISWSVHCLLIFAHKALPPIRISTTVNTITVSPGILVITMNNRGMGTSLFDQDID